MDGLDELSDSDSGGCVTARHPLLHIIISRELQCHYHGNFDMSVCWYITITRPCTAAYYCVMCMYVRINIAPVPIFDMFIGSEAPTEVGTESLGQSPNPTFGRQPQLCM